MTAVLINRRAVLGAGVVCAAALPAMAQDRRMTAYKTPWCGCCDGWVAHMRAAGWTVEVIELEDLAPVRHAAVALSAPGMPAGSPGMEASGREPYVTLLIDRQGRTTVFGRHNGA